MAFIRLFLKNYIFDEKKFLILLYIFSLSLKILFGYFVYDKFQPLKYDYSPHENTAVNFMNGRGLVYDFKVSDTLIISRYNEDELLYPLICGIVYFFSNHNTVLMLLIQAFYASFIPIFIYLITKFIFEIKIARLAALISALVPGIIIYSVGKIHSMTLYALIFCILLWSVFIFIKKQSTPNSLLLGVMLGIGFLSRNNLVFFIPFLALYLYFSQKVKISKLFFVALVFCLTLTPLIVRNYRIYHKLVLTKTPTWWTVYEGTIYNNKGEATLFDMNKKLFAGYTQLKDYEYSDIINAQALEYLKTNKINFLKNFAKRFYYFWWFAPRTGCEYPKSYLKAYTPYYILLLFLFMYALLELSYRYFINKITKDDYWVVILLFISSVTLVHYAAYTEGRHRFSLEPIMAIFAAYGFYKVKNLLVKKKGD